MSLRSSAFRYFIRGGDLVVVPVWRAKVRSLAMVTPSERRASLAG